MVLSPAWKWQFFAGVPLAALLLCAFVTITPYSPRWLVTKGRVEEARRILVGLRGDEGLADAELANIEHTVAETASTDIWPQLSQRHVVWAVALGVILSFIQQWSGCNAVNACEALARPRHRAAWCPHATPVAPWLPPLADAQTIFAHAGFSAADSKMQAIYIGVCKLVFVLVALALVDRAGRRALLLWGTALMAAALAVFTSMQVLLDRGEATQAISYTAAGSIMLYMAAFEISCGPILWILLSELYPLGVRGVAMSIGSTSCWLWTVSVTLLFPILLNAIGDIAVFGIFTGVCAVAWVWMWLYIPETKGRTLEQIEDMLRHGGTGIGGVAKDGSDGSLGVDSWQHDGDGSFMSPHGRSMGSGSSGGIQLGGGAAAAWQPPRRL